MRRLLILLMVLPVVAGCSMMGDGVAPSPSRTTDPLPPVATPAAMTESPAAALISAPPLAGGCAAFDLSPHRCDAIVEAVALGLHIAPTDAKSIELLGDPGCGDAGVVCTRSTRFVVRVRFHMPDGSAPEDSVFCGFNGQYSILCTETPEVPVAADLVQGGYMDIPCTGEQPPDGCPTPLPAIDPKTAVDARPLSVQAMDIPLDRIGPYSVELGRATVPNGILSAASFTLADVHPTKWSVTDEGVRLVIESLDGGPPFSNRYEHGWHPGVERVVAKAVFEVTSAEPGAVMQIRDVVVR